MVADENKLSLKQGKDNLLAKTGEVPDAIETILECNLNDNLEEKQTPSAEVCLFFSFDIVNSTIFKSMTSSWPIIIKELLERIKDRILQDSDLSTAILWRVIGDELVFVMSIQTVKQLALAVKRIFENTQAISCRLKNGNFFSSIQDQRITRGEIGMLKEQDMLSVKAAAWITSVNKEIVEQYDTIQFNYSASAKNQVITEYLGKDMDCGFRLKKYTQDRRLIVSFEIACLLSENDNNNLYIIDYVKLKGIWNESLYPIIWYYDKEIVETCYQIIMGETRDVPFLKSFRYDETDNNPLVANYFTYQSQRASPKKSERNRGSITIGKDVNLPKSMFTVNSALTKIVNDRGLKNKIKYFEALLDTGSKKNSTRNVFDSPLELHCAVVCCDVDQKKILIVHRGEDHTLNKNKWEFGCAKIKSSESLKKTICTYYKITFGIEIELVLDQKRSEQQPLPIGMYEIDNGNNIKKGIICVAKVTNKSNGFRPQSSYKDIQWVSESDIDQYNPKEAVTDFHETLKHVFCNFSKYFKE